jgi:hypothetical protein
MILSASTATTSARAEFIANAFGGKAEDQTRAAAALAFQGYEVFYASMADLERRARDKARAGFAKSMALMNQAQSGYERAANLLDNTPFNYDKIGPAQTALLVKFLSEFGGRPGDPTRLVFIHYSKSFAQTEKLISEGSNQMSLAKFREIQIFVQRQINVGTLISQAMTP